MKYTLLSFAILCSTIIYAQSSKVDVHNALFDKLYETTAIQSAINFDEIAILENANPCLKMDCSLFSDENKKRFLIRTYEDMFLRVMKSSYIIVDKVDYIKKTLNVRIIFRDSSADMKTDNFKRVTIQL